MRWFVPELAMHRVAESQFSVHNPLNGATFVLSADICAVVAACRGCRTLAEHEARAADSLSAPAEHRPAIRGCLELCARLGLLLSLADLAARCSPSEAASLPPLGAVVIRTSDRPRMLERLLASAARLEARTGSGYRWHVVDDSRAMANRRGNREILGRHRAMSLTYHDLSDGSLAAELERVFPDVGEEIRWLIGAPCGDEATYGRPVNYALLRFAGERFLVMDDDAILQPRRSPSSGREVAIGRVNDELRWYPSLEAAWDDCPEADLDPIAEHGRWLGVPLAEIWSRVLRHREQLGLTELAAEQAARFCPKARVLFTQNHAIGDPGWAGWPFKELTLPAASRTWLAAHPETVAFAFDTSFNWRGALELRLIPDGDVSTTTLGGIDNRHLMPPTARATRGEDCFLGSTAGIVCPWAWSVDLPFALPHLRATPRRRLSPTEIPTPEPLQFFIQYARTRGGISLADNAETRMAALGAVYLDIASASDATLAELLRERAATWAAWQVDHLTQQLADETLPKAWKDALRAWLSSPQLRLDNASLDATVASPSAVRAIASGYGKALLAWPRLWRHCRNLKGAHVGAN